ncbi:MAG: maleylpyruvate isomerase family mycothiol-dependent enzyme [Streptosporangiaceae bacterium]
MITEDRLGTGLRESTARLADVVASSDEAARIPTCPDWSLRQLATHVGRAHRWAGEMVDRRVTEILSFREAPDGKLPADPAARPGWLIAGADRLADAVERAGTEPVWTFLGMLPSRFWLRRMTHETIVHSADAELAVGREVVVPADLAVDAIDEWFEMVTGDGDNDGQAVPLAEGRSLHVHATDEGLNGTGEWLVTRTPSGLAVEAGHAKADVAVRGPAGTLLLVLLRRLPTSTPGVDVLGDTSVLTEWLARTAF